MLRPFVLYTGKDGQYLDHATYSVFLWVPPDVFHYSGIQQLEQVLKLITLLFYLCSFYFMIYIMKLGKSKETHCIVYYTWIILIQNLDDLFICDLCSVFLRISPVSWSNLKQTSYRGKAFSFNKVSALMFYTLFLTLKLTSEKKTTWT